MLEFYLAEVARAKSDNLIQGVHFALENELTPAEFERLALDVESAGVALPAVCRAWIAQTRHLLRFGTSGFRPFVRRPCGPGATLYTAPDGMPVDPGRTFIVAFAGDAHRLMIPIAAFLQHCDPARHELLLLFDPSRSLFLRGIPGIAPDFAALMTWIRGHIEARAAARTVAFGASAGGLAAVWAALDLGLDRAVSIGGTSTEQVVERHQTQGLDISGFDDAIRRRAGTLPEVAYVYGDRCERDRLKGVALGSRLPVTMVPMPRFGQHNVIFEALRRGSLAALIDLVVGERRVAEAMLDPAGQGWAA
jgi:hypothetical protein